MLTDLAKEPHPLHQQAPQILNIHAIGSLSAATEHRNLHCCPQLAQLTSPSVALTFPDEAQGRRTNKSRTNKHLEITFQNNKAISMCFSQGVHVLQLNHPCTSTR